MSDVNSNGIPRRVRLAVFGLGRIGNTHMLNILKNRSRAELLYVIDEYLELCKEAISKYHLEETKALAPKEADIVFNDERVDAILVCTPTDTHAGIIGKAIAHGKGVFSEKPLADTLDNIRACYLAAEKANVPLLCSFNRRFDPGYRALRNRIKSGEVGKIKVLKTVCRDFSPPSAEYLRHSGGIFHDAAIHDIDVVCWVAGDFPESVFVQGYTHEPDIAALNDTDTAVIVYKFKDGTIATSEVCRDAVFGYDQRLEVLGSRGQLDVKNYHVTQLQCYTPAGVQTDRMMDSFLDRYADSYNLVLQHFLDVMQGISEPEVRRLEVENSFRIAEACQQSRDQGRLIKICYD